MIKINLSPVRSDDSPLQAEWVAPILTVNGTPYDLSELPDGATAQHPVLGTIDRVGDDYEVTLRLPHGPEQWLPAGPPSDPIYCVGDESYFNRDDALADAAVMDPEATTVEILAEQQYQHASEAQRFPDAVTLTANGPVPVPQPNTKTETQEAGDVEAFRAEAWGNEA